LNPAPDDPATLRAGLDAAEAAFALAISLARQQLALREDGASSAVEAPLHGPVSRDGWIAAHRSGRPSVIESDPELRAFVEARLGAMTFTRIVAEVAASFPEGRRTSLSALSRYWRKTRGLDSGKRRGRA
jgi:hypothetical protein